MMFNLTFAAGRHHCVSVSSGFVSIFLEPEGETGDGNVFWFWLMLASFVFVVRFAKAKKKQNAPIKRQEC